MHKRNKLTGKNKNIGARLRVLLYTYSVNNVEENLKYNLLKCTNDRTTIYIFFYQIDEGDVDEDETW